MQLLTWIFPHNVRHPNIRPPHICVGHIVPEMEITDLLYQVFDIITYNKWAPGDCLNPELLRNLPATTRSGFRWIAGP